MKPLFFLSLLLFFFRAAGQQNPEPVSTSVNTDYLKKSRGQQRTAWILLGGGGALTTTGLILGLTSVDNEIVSAFSGNRDNTMEVGAVFFYAGIACMIGSVPFFIASAKNKNRGSSVSGFIKMESRQLLAGRNLLPAPYPAVGLKIPIR